MTDGNDVRRMQKVFEKYHSKYEPYKLFERFLEYVIAGFDQTFSALEKPFDNDEGTACMNLLQEWIMIMQERLKTREWYDLLGEVYMVYLSGTMKKHWTGQYFTPMHICDLMADITKTEKADGRVLDNACGSGRMLLAEHIRYPKAYCCAQDLDRICCLMTVCNFIVHGVNGEVIWGDGLNPNDYRGGWRTNEMLNIAGIPSVRTMKQKESFLSFALDEEYKKSMVQDEREVSGQSCANEIKPTKRKKRENIYQASLFDL